MSMKRRGSAFYRAEMSRMLDQFQPGFVVAPTFVNSPNDGLRGIVTAANRVENKVYVAWNGGSVKQHDPDELMIVSMPVHVQNAPAQMREESVMDNPTSNEEAKTEQAVELMRKAGVGRRMAKKFKDGDKIKYRSPDGTTQDGVVSNATEYKGKIKVTPEEKNTSSGKSDILVDIDKISTRRMAMYHAQPGRTYRRTRAETESNEANCPKCGGDMDIEPFTKSEKMWRCSECGWKIPTSKVLA
jgi:ribosomal protein L37AE/L43A